MIREPSTKWCKSCRNLVAVGRFSEDAAMCLGCRESMGLKVCAKCGFEGPIDFFVPHKPECRECRQLYQREQDYYKRRKRQLKHGAYCVGCRDYHPASAFDVRPGEFGPVLRRNCREGRPKKTRSESVPARRAAINTPIKPLPPVLVFPSRAGSGKSLIEVFDDILANLDPGVKARVADIEAERNAKALKRAA